MSKKEETKAVASPKSAEPKPVQKSAAQKKLEERMKKGVHVWFQSRIDGPDQKPQMSDDPFEGTVREVVYPRIPHPLHKGLPYRLRGQDWICERGLLIYLIMKESRLRYSRKECIEKGFLTEEDFVAIEMGVHPDEEKDTPNEVPFMRVPDVDMLTEKELVDWLNQVNIKVPAGLGGVELKNFVRKVLGQPARPNA